MYHATSKDMPLLQDNVRAAPAPYMPNPIVPFPDPKPIPSPPGPLPDVSWPFSERVLFPYILPRSSAVQLHATST
jgi:hypothetical protein